MDSPAALLQTEALWNEWSSRCTYQGAYKEP